MADELGDPLAWFLDEMRVVRGASPHTVSNYGRDLGKYRTFMETRHLRRWEDVRPSTVEEFVAQLAHGDEEHPPLAASSVARTLSAVRSFHRWLMTQNLAQSNPAAQVKPPKTGESLPKALSVAQVARLIEGSQAGPELVALRNHALVELLYGTGARVSEATNLALDDLDLEGEYPSVRLFGKGSKERMVPLGAYAHAALGAYLSRSRPALAQRGRGTAHLFLNLRGRPLSRQSAWEIIQQAASAAGLEEEISPHTLRHSFATHLLEGGASIREVQELLGHASVTTTQIYTRLTPQGLLEVFQAAHPRAR
ncbi:site-specific tyrosine recombinase XerD [Scrofimicrobium sp. R131]|uniref:Tyrosine recombinase XerC n=1 Tax=Scrofimicrobium appendicitidis TaxID=3079930 RepID=A0AAU7V4M9_9ACTO